MNGNIKYIKIRSKNLSIRVPKLKLECLILEEKDGFDFAQYQCFKLKYRDLKLLKTADLDDVIGENIIGYNEDLVIYSIEAVTRDE